MNSVRVRKLQKSFRNFVNPGPRNDLSGAPRCYGAPAVVESESFSKYDAFRFPKNDSSLRSGSTNGSDIIEVAPGQDHLSSDGRNFLEKGAKNFQDSTKIWRSPEDKARSLLCSKGLQQRDTQRKSLTAADVCRVLDAQKDPAMAWKHFVWTGKQPGFKHHLTTCHQMIQTFCNTENFDLAPELFEFMRKAGIPLTNFACSRIIQGLAEGGRHRDAINTIRDVLASGYNADTFMYNHYLNALVKTGDYDQIEAVYSEMRRHGSVPNVYTYSILINAFGKSKETSKAWDTYTEMKAQGCRPNQVTWRSMMLVLKEAGKTEKARQVMDESLNNRVLKTSSSNAVPTVKECPSGGAVQEPKGDVDAQASFGERVSSLLRNTEDPDLAMHALLDMVSQDRTPSTQVCNSVLLSLGKAGKADLALELVRDLRSKNVLDNVSYEVTIGALCEASKIDEALLLKTEMQEQGLLPSTNICNKVMRYLYMTQQPDRVFEFFSQLQNFEPTASTYIGLMSALCKTDEVGTALRCLKNAGLVEESLSTRAQAGLHLIHSIENPRVSIYMLLLSTLCWNHRADDAAHVLLHMQENGVFVRMRTSSKYAELRAYKRVLSELSSQGKVEMTWRLFQGLKSSGVDKARIYRAMLTVLREAGWFPLVLKVMEEMRSTGSPPDVYAYTAFMSSLGKRGKLDDMHRVLDLMEGDGCAPNTYTYNVLSGSLAKAGQVDKAYNIFERGIDNGCIPDVHSYNALLRAFFRAKRLPEAADLYNVMLAMGCEPNETTHKILFHERHAAGLPEMAA